MFQFKVCENQNQRLIVLRCFGSLGFIANLTNKDISGVVVVFLKAKAKLSRDKFSIIMFMFEMTLLI